jgi:hypothetical protein
MDHLPATFLDGVPIEVRVEIFQPEPIRPVVQPSMSDCLPFTEVTESAVYVAPSERSSNGVGIRTSFTIM